LGEVSLNQCEVTYVNHVVSGQSWQELGELGEVLTVFSPRYSEAFLGEPEDVRMFMRYIIPDAEGRPAGRLHVAVEPAYRVSDDLPMYVVTLTARGRPLGEGIGGAMQFLDRGRQWVVRGFASLTTPEMHVAWRRQHDR
jgi:hypothetical protein